MKFEDMFSGNVPVFLAPMAGITDDPFRRVVSSFGATAVVSEMVSSEALVRNIAKTYVRLQSSNRNILKIVQIVGANPENMAKSAIINEELGANAIDINMGCPVRKIVSNDSGSALMKDEELAIKIAKAIVKSVKIPVTVKMRLGWDSESINFASLARKFEDIGIKMLAIHCRTRKQMYSEKADWSQIARLRDEISIPYLCNGDIISPETAAAALNASRANGVMIGRGALGKPWLLRQIMDAFEGSKPRKPPSISEQFEIVMSHFAEVLDFYGESSGIRIFRKHFCWYSAGFAGASNFRTTINKAEELPEIKKIVEEFYAKQESRSNHQKSNSL